MHAALEDSRREVQMQYSGACVFQLGNQQTSRRESSDGGRMDEKFQGMDKSKGCGFRRRVSTIRYLYSYFH